MHLLELVLVPYLLGCLAHLLPFFLVVTVKMMPGYSITIPNATLHAMDTAVPGHKLNLDKTLSQKLKRSLRTSAGAPFLSHILVLAD